LRHRAADDYAPALLHVQEHLVEDVATGIVVVRIDAVRAQFAQPRGDVVRLVVDRRVVVTALDDPAAIIVVTRKSGPPSPRPGPGQCRRPRGRWPRWRPRPPPCHPAARAADPPCRSRPSGHPRQTCPGSTTTGSSPWAAPAAASGRLAAPPRSPPSS